MRVGEIGHGNDTMNMSLRPFCTYVYIYIYTCLCCVPMFVWLQFKLLNNYKFEQPIYHLPLVLRFHT